MIVFKMLSWFSSLIHPYYNRILFTLIVSTFLMCRSSVVIAQSTDDCMMCHEDSELTGTNADGEEYSAYVDRGVFEESVHGFLECIDCHTDLYDFEDYPHDAPLEKVDCSLCHDDVAEEFNSSRHAFALRAGNLKVPDCSSCHGVHDILSSTDEKSLTYPVNLPNTCGTCHNQGQLTLDPDVKLGRSLETYMSSVHGKALQAGNLDAANCNDCHGVHDLRGSGDVLSKINRANISSTCAPCHEDAFRDYTKSIHGKASALGITDSPVCTDCHGSHLIFAASEEASYTNRHNLSHAICEDCHEDPRLVARYGLQTGVGKTYSDSYHGMATRRGSIVAATCVSCHNSHLVLPSQNPESLTHPDNVTETCAQCHADATYNFAVSYTHEARDPERNPVVGFVSIAYISLIIVIIGGMILHNVLILLYYIRKRYQKERAEAHVARFDIHIILQHLFVLISFFILAITGFALVYLDAWWVKILTDIGMDEDLRRLLHRISAVVMIGAGLYHIVYMFFSKRGRIELTEMKPQKSDISDLMTNIRYHIGKAGQRPAFPKYSYIEKAEYWALVWGVAVMALTGFVLWFPTLFTQFLPIWSVQVSELIHFYEAWLATLAIFVWHFFFVIFHPEAYPLNMAMITGKYPMDNTIHHYKRWYQNMFRPVSTARDQEADAFDSKESDDE